MMPANKILTVAYGTFSCTLEGFDDPFSAMTDIAEYFRDLAAEDRYFGAEPPQPDPAMLRQIAETRANRQIEAEPREDGVTLRPSEAAEAPRPTAAPVEEAEGVVDIAPDVAFDGDEDPIDAMVEGAFDAHDAAQLAPAPARDSAPSDSQADSVAEKLARIRGVVEADRNSGTDYEEDEHAEEWTGFDTEPTEAPLSGIEAAVEDSVEVALVSQTDAEAADEAQADPVGDDDTVAFEAEVLAEDEATVEDEAPVEEEATVEGEAAVEDALFFEENVEPEADAVETEAVAEDDATEEGADDAVAEDGEDEVNDSFEFDSILDAVEPDTTEDETPEAVESEGDADAAAMTEEPERRVRRLRIRRRAQAELAAAAEAAEQLPAGTASAMASADAPVEDAETQTADHIEDNVDASHEVLAQADLPEDDEADLMAELAAIAAEDETTEDAIAQGEDDDQDDDDLPDDLDALLAAAEADPTGDETRETAEMRDEDAVDTADAADVEEDELDLSDDDSDSNDLERLFAATDSRLEGAETSRVHANISHLKAAVAARRADSSMDSPKADGTDAYRVDLANTVRPRRTEGSEGARTERPPARPAPLVLVSAQRVEDEAPAAEPADPIRPRRVNSRQTDELETSAASADAARIEAEQTDDDASLDTEPGTDFEAFAAEMGATDLASILEAAAAYTTRTLGEETFSRPRLLHLASEAGEEFSREDGLRGFGQLLRDGVIQKVSRGTFTLAEDSRYVAEAARRAG